MRRLRWLALAGLLALLPLEACTEAHAAARLDSKALAVVAAGDTLKATQPYSVSGTPDSIRWLFSARNAPAQSLTRVAPPNGTALTAGPALLIPSPALAEGDTVTVSACPTMWKRGQTFTAPCTTALYTRPVVPPVVTPGPLQVVGFEVYPQGPMATAKSTTACLLAYNASSPSNGWSGMWDATTGNFKSVCLDPSGTPRVAAYCVAHVMGDGVRFLTNAYWGSKPWCARYTAQVPNAQLAVKTGPVSARQYAADSFFVWMEARQKNGYPMPGFVWEDRWNLVMARDTVTTTIPSPYQVGFALARHAGQMRVFPDSTVYLLARAYYPDGSPYPMTGATFTPGPNSGTVSTVVVGQAPRLTSPADRYLAGPSRWAAYGS